MTVKKVAQVDDDYYIVELHIPFTLVASAKRWGLERLKKETWFVNRLRDAIEEKLKVEKLADKFHELCRTVTFPGPGGNVPVGHFKKADVEWLKYSLLCPSGARLDEFKIWYCQLRKLDPITL